MNLYDNIGAVYNTTRKADPFIFAKLFELLSPSENKLYLDIGCGTGNYTCKFAERGIHFYGVDPSEQMLQEAKTKTDKIQWLSGEAEQIPVDNEFFDGIIATLTIHHWNNPGKAFRELYRILKTGGRLVIFTSTPEQMRGYWLNHYFPGMLQNSIEQMPDPEKIKIAADNSGFHISRTEKYFIQDGLQDLFLYAGKNKPEIYFDPLVRRGISSFSALTNKEEVESGLAQLNSDIKDKSFEEIKNKFENNLGDYLFIVAEK